MNKKVAILLVLYNDTQHIPGLINSIKEQTYKNIYLYAIETSPGGKSLKLLEYYYPELRKFKYSGNLGFAAGNNYLAKKAFEDGADYIFVLNTDMILDKDCVYELVKLIDSNKNIGGVAPIVFFGEDGKITNKIQCYAEDINYNTGKITSIFPLSIKYENLPEIVKVTSLHGGTTFISSKMYEETGLFDEELFMYGEERDFAYRIKETKYLFYVTKVAKSWHFHDRSTNNKIGFRREYYYIMRNKILFFYKYKKYLFILLELVKNLIKMPFIVRWGIQRKDVLLIKYYYLGLLHGLLKQKGKSNIKF